MLNAADDLTVTRSDLRINNAIWLQISCVNDKYFKYDTLRSVKINMNKPSAIVLLQAICWIVIYIPVRNSFVCVTEGFPWHRTAQKLILESWLHTNEQTLQVACTNKTENFSPTNMLYDVRKCALDSNPITNILVITGRNVGIYEFFTHCSPLC